MVIEELENFLFDISEDKKSRYRGFNFLYTETSFTNQYEGESFSKEVFKWIKQTNEELNDKLKQTTETYRKSNIQVEIDVLEIINNKDFLIQWLKCVDSINQVKNKYIEELIKIDKPIKYLIISEAPPLSIINKTLSSNYVFLNIENTTDKYRTVPFEVIKDLEKDNTSLLGKETKGDDLINFYAKHRVAFIDIIPIPLPTIATNLRKHWCTDLFYTIDGKTPRIIEFLNLSISKFQSELGNVCFSPDLKIAFMAPTTISENIVKWLTIEKFDKNSVSNFMNIFPNRLLNNNYSELSNLIAVDGSHNPNTKSLKKAFLL